LKIHELWKYKHNEPILGLELGDINNNGQTELLAYSKSGNILIISLDGRLIQKEEIFKKSSIWCAKISDIDKDGKNELLIGGMDGILKVFKCESNSYKLSLFWSHKLSSSISGIIIKDINNDKFDEILVYSLDKSLRALNPLNGDLLWGAVFEKGIGDVIVWENDELALHLKEIYACGNDGTIRVFNPLNGELIWFKRFFEKIRCINGLNSSEGAIILCGGDDKTLHFIDKEDRLEIKHIKFKDYVWKCVSFPSQMRNKALVSTYSFAYFDNSIPIEKIEFSSKIVCINENLEIIWTLSGKNIEYIQIFEKQESLYILLGTTVGELLILNGNDGNILSEINKNSCLNMVQILNNVNLLFSCHDNGNIYSYLLEDY